MIQPSSTEFKDQASGLRQMFKTDALPVHVLVCPARPALVLPLTQVLSQVLADRGLKLVWLEELAMGQRESWPTACQVRFDVGQSLAGHVDLSAALHLIKPNLMYGLSCQTRRLERWDRPLQQRLQSSGVRFDAVLVAADPNSKTQAYASHVQHTLITGTDTHSLNQSLKWMQMTERQASSSVAFNVIALGSATRIKSVQAWLDQAGSEMTQVPRLLAWAPAKTMDKSLQQAWAGQSDLQNELTLHLLKH
jgi:hypothetical protein